MPNLNLGGRKLHLSACDLVIPLAIAIVLHVLLIAGLVTSLVISNVAFHKSECSSTFENILIGFICAYLACHTCIVILDSIALYLAFHVPVMSHSSLLHNILHCRLGFNFFEIVLIVFGMYCIFSKHFACLSDHLAVYIVFSSNVCLIIFSFVFLHFYFSFSFFDEFKFYIYRYFSIF